MAGGSEAYFLKWTAQHVKNFSNLNHKCPYFGSTWINIERIAVNKLIMMEQLMPSGRYRVDLNVTEGIHQDAFITTKFYFGISDNRIEQF